MARRLRESADIPDFFDSEWQLMLLYFGHLITMQIADLEWRHGRNRNRSHRHGQTSLAQFTAQFVASEATVLHKAQVARSKISSTRSRGFLEGRSSCRSTLVSFFRRSNLSVFL